MKEENTENKENVKKVTFLKKSSEKLISFEEKNFLKAVKNTSLQEAMKDLGWTEEMIIKSCKLKDFNRAYYNALGVTEKQFSFLRIFSKKMLNVKQTAQAIGIARKTYYEWMKTNNVFKESIEDMKESLYDDVESVLCQKIFIDKDTTCLIWFMKTRMKHRGYFEKSEHIVASEQPLFKLPKTNDSISSNKGISEYSSHE